MKAVNQRALTTNKLNHLHSSSSSSSSPTSSPKSPNAKTLIFNPKMGARKSLIKPILVTISFLLAIYVFFNSILYYTPTNLDSNHLHLLNSKSKSSPLRIYMYDLPRKFTYGVIESYAKARNGDFMNLKYPGNQHAAEWYLFSDLIRSDSKLRVLDPEQADLFYVPFFSSLSLVANPIRQPDGDRTGYSDEEMQEGLIEWLEEQVYWKRNNGWDHVFICQDPNALYKVVDRVKNGVLLVSDFGRLGKNQASLVKDVILPYAHRINSFKGSVGVDERKSLLFFMGNRYRKEGGKIRDMLFQLLENEKDVVIKHGAQSRESRRMASQGMHTSKFCLHPAGDTPSAARLFDAIVSLCVPVIVSDYIELPFEDVIDYRKIAVFVDSESSVQPGYLVRMLRNVSSDKILEFQQELQKVKHYFEYEDPNGPVREIWRQVSMKVPLIKLMINRDKRIVKRELTEPDCSCLCSNKSGIHTNF